MGRLKLCLPEPEHEAAVLEYLAGYAQCGETPLNMSGFETYAEWLLGVNNRRAGIALRQNRVASTLFLVFDETGTVVGTADIKPKLNEQLLQYGGHIGYAVLPAKRGQGCATQILSLMLQYAKEIGLARVLLTTNAPNIASQRVIEKNGGVFENMLFNAAENTMVKRYWVDLNQQ